MIIEPFTVNSGGTNYRLVDILAIDSEGRKRQAEQRIGASLAFTQQGARCESRGLLPRGPIDNMFFAVLIGPQLVGCWMLGKLEYVSGPWDDDNNWQRINPSADIILRGVPMTGIIDGLTFVQEGLVGVEVAAKLLDPNRTLVTAQGRTVGFDKLEYALFKASTDPIDTRAKAHNAQIKNDSRFTVTETPHPSISGLTLVEVVWA